MRKIIKLMILTFCFCIASIGFSNAEMIFSPTLNIDTSVAGKIIVTVSSDGDNDAILADRKPSLSIPCEFTKAHVEYEGKTISSSIKDGEITFVVEKSGEYTIVKEATTVNQRPSSSGGGGSSSKTTTKTTTNDDGSVTKTVTDSKTGTVTETTENKDGSTTVVETSKDGKTTTTVTDNLGNKAEVTKTADGDTSVSVSVVKSNEKVQVPVSPISNNSKINVTVSEAVQVVLPVENSESSLVAVIVYEDGTEEVIRKSVLDENNMLVPMIESATIKVIDNSKDFSDTTNHWGESAIEFVTSHELFSGTSEDTFEPNIPMNRAMIAQVLHNLETNPETDYDTSFNDVSDGAWYQEAVNWAADKGIVSGYTNGMFGAKDNVTREQLVTILYNYAKTNEYDVSVGEDTNILSYKDFEKTSEYAISALQWAVGAGIMSGNDEGELNPKGYATRAEVASMLHRFCSNVR